MPTLKEKREHLFTNFARKCTEVEQIKHLFPLNDKNHHMKTRHNEPYKIQKFNTERMRNSTIVQIQMKLNSIS